MVDMKRDHPLTREAVTALLKAHDILPTAQRVEIAYALCHRPQHLSADQVLAMVNQDLSLVSKATIYNTLNLFARKGLIREVVVDHQCVLYDPNSVPHHHFYNVDTGEVTDVQEEQVEFSRLPPTPPGTEAAGVDVVIRVRAPRLP